MQWKNVTEINRKFFFNTFLFRKSRGSLYKEVQLFLNDTDSINKVEITVRPVKFIIHGFGSSRFDEGLKLMKESKTLFYMYDYNY